jgi:ADP-ribose pyrophosphatase YjhB (NUDIX family)
MKRIWIIIAVALVVTACQETLEDRCEREAKEYTEKHCPTPIAKDIVMDSMTFDKATHTITYAYTLSGQLDDSAVVNGSNSRELLLQEVKNSTNMKLYKDAGFSFRYTYFSTKEKGTKLFEATFRKSDYNQ